MLSPKHGVNPTLGVCFFCGKETGEIALLGKLPNDKEAPKYCVMSYEPCQKCKEHLKQGVMIISVTPYENTPNQPPIVKTDAGELLYPVPGEWVVVKDEAITKMCDKNTAEEALTKRKLLMDFILFNTWMMKSKPKDDNI